MTNCKKGPKDGDYCAKVTFQSSNTEKASVYTLVVSVKDNKLVDINFPETHFDKSSIKSTDIPDDGKFVAVSTSGQVYKVEMKGDAEKCLDAVNLLQCQGKSKSGAACKRLTGNKNGFCWQHQEQVGG